MQSLQGIKHQLELANVFLADYRKKRDAAFNAMEAAPKGSRMRRTLYEKNDEAERNFSRMQATVETLEWVLSEPVGLRWFAFCTKQPYDCPPAKNITYAGTMAFLETTYEAKELLVDAGYKFLRSRPDVKGTPDSIPITYLETIDDFERLVGQLANVRVHLHRPDFTK